LGFATLVSKDIYLVYDLNEKDNLSSDIAFIDYTFMLLRLCFS